MLVNLVVDKNTHYVKAIFTSGTSNNVLDTEYVAYDVELNSDMLNTNFTYKDETIKVLPVKPNGPYQWNGTAWVKFIEAPKEYVLQRKNEYPEVRDQLDMLWHSMNNGDSEISEPFYSTIKEIKIKYPKDA